MQRRFFFGSHNRNHTYFLVTPFGVHKHRKGRTSKINVFLVTYLIRNQRVLLSLRFHIEILRFYYYLLFVLENIGSCNNGTRRKDKDGELLKDSK